MIRLLIEGLNEDFYLAWHEDKDLFRGSSGIDHFFEGIVILNESIDLENPWLLKCITTSHNPLEAVESVSSKLEDINLKKCILFLPTYPSQKAMRFSVKAFAEKDQEIIMLYLHNLYEILKIDLNNQKDKLRDYLNDMRIRE